MYILRTDNLLTGLIDLVNFIPVDGVMAEIGCYSGESTFQFAKKFKRIYAIDPWITDNGFFTDMHIVEKTFDDRMNVYDNVIKIKDIGNNAVRMFEDRSLDFVYIDALHDYFNVKNDIITWLPKVKIGGYIGGHDHDPNVYPGVVNAVKETVGDPNFLFIDTSWITKVND